MQQFVNLPPNNSHERRGHSRLDLALYRTRVRSMQLLGCLQYRFANLLWQRERHK